MNQTKVKKFLKEECAGYVCVMFTRAKLEKLASLLNDNDYIVIESNGNVHLSMSTIGGDVLLEV